MGKTVLVVDDEPDIRVLAKITLQSAGFDVMEAESGEDALAAVERTNPDAVLLDIRMPGMNGWEVLEQLKSTDRYGEVPVVVFSAHEMTTAPERAREQGSAGFLAKPFLPEELVEAVNSALGQGAGASDEGRTGRLEDVVAAALKPGEQVELSSEALARVKLQFFHRCAVYLTDRRLLIFKPAWPWGYKLNSSFWREDCQIHKFKKRPDGSRLLIIKQPAGVECLYFSLRWRSQGDQLIQAIGLADDATESD